MVNIPRGSKMEERAKEVRMVGYAKPGYKLYDPITDTVVTSRDVRFDETDIGYTEMEEKKIQESLSDSIHQTKIKQQMKYKLR
ncbi:hypothetical protein QE152_g3822 [Popillia japonica]|uniref:Retroviral polymerase SH3-like domain-containing protein n=1 Tax=Popillia japonica TaxID=7064 RepID=A0AAW1N334_POPJA